eukprot:9567372-Prorocentrum_lima.AAC.1
MQTQIEVQGNAEALLQAQLESVQDRVSVEEQRARYEEEELCQKLIDEELKKRDEARQQLMNSR